jgi:hypothetical protein
LEIAVMSDAIQFHSRVGSDGVLSVQVNLGSAEASKDVVVTVSPIEGAEKTAGTGALPWQEFVEATYGSCAGMGLERADQGELEVREPID